MDNLLAFVAMLLDHTGIILFPSNEFLRLFGRIAMPMYAYGIARGYYFSKKHNTFAKYTHNLLYFALASQLPFIVMVNKAELCVMFTWLFAVNLLDYIVTEEYKKMYVLIVVFTLMQSFVPSDYGILGFLLPSVIYLFENDHFEKQKNLSLMLYPFTLLLIVAFGIIENRWIIAECFCILYIPIMGFCLSADKLKKIVLPKWVKYSMYPLSMIIPLCIKALLNLL